MAAEKPTTKSTGKKKSPAKAVRKPAPSRAARGQTVRGHIAVGGNIIAKRDVIMRDQINVTDNRTAQIQTAPQLAAELQALRGEIAALRAQPGLDEGERQIVTVVEARVQDAQVEAAKPEPDGDQVITTLEKATKTMAALTGGVTTAVGLGEAIGRVGPYLNNVLEAARRMFGG
jgi:hypothetical protein